MTVQQIQVVVGSTNPVKINAIKSAIACYFPSAQLHCRGMHAPSGVPEQPMNSQETRQGAINRLRYCQQNTQADYYAAIEGGVECFEEGPATFAYIAIAKGDQLSVGRGANLPLPQALFQRLAHGEELGPLMDTLFNTENIKQKGGAIGLLTCGHATRESNYTHAAILTMARFAHPELYP